MEETKKEYMKRYRLDNRDRIKQYQKEYRIRNNSVLKKKKSIYDKKRIKELGEIINKPKREDYMKNPIKYKNYRENSKEKIKLYSKQYRNLHKMENRVRKQAQVLRETLMTKRGNFCEDCGKVKIVDIHHIEYNNLEENLILLCRKCHKKAHRNLIEMELKGGNY